MAVGAKQFFLGTKRAKLSLKSTGIHAANKFIKPQGFGHTPSCANLMAQQPHTKSLPSLHAFTMKPQFQINSISPKIKTLIPTYAYRQLCHVVRALAYAKSMVLELFDSKNDAKNYNTKLRRKNKKKKIIRAIRALYTRSSSHVLPMPEPRSIEAFDTSHAYYDSTWNSMIPTDQEGNDDMEPVVLSGYLQWLEEKENDDGASDNIDRLAEKFIESCHEKFRLEKQESYRRYQEMLARSL